MSSQPTGSAAAQGAGARMSVREVAARRMRFSLWLAIVLMVIYLAFTFMAALTPGFLARQVADSITLALVLSVAVIVVAWIFTCVYMRWANRYHDAACDDIGRETLR